jgi:hypothetical protein
MPEPITIASKVFCCIPLEFIFTFKESPGIKKTLRGKVQELKL